MAKWTKDEKRLLKLADAHIRKLEAAGGKATKYAYARLRKDLERLGLYTDPASKMRVDRAAPDNDRRRRALVNAVKTFMSSQTSTPAAITRLEKRNLDRFNSRFGTNLTLSQYAAVAEIYERSNFGSYQITQVIKAVERHDASFLRDLGMIVDNQVDIFGVSSGISSNSQLLNEVLSAMGEDLSAWKTSEILPI